MYKHVNSYISHEVINDIISDFKEKSILTSYETWLVKVLNLEEEFDGITTDSSNLFRPEDIEDRYRDVYACIDNGNYEQAKLQLSMLPIDDPETVEVDNRVFFMRH